MEARSTNNSRVPSPAASPSGPNIPTKPANTPGLGRRLASRLSALRGSLTQLTRRLLARVHPFYRWRTIRMECVPELKVAPHPPTRLDAKKWRLSPAQGGRYPWGPVLFSLSVDRGPFPITARLHGRVGEKLNEGLESWLVLESPELKNQLIQLPRDIRELTLSLHHEGEELGIVSCTFRELGKVHRAASKGAALVRAVIRNPRLVRDKFSKALALYRRGGLRAIRDRLWRSDVYPEWVRAHDTFSELDRARMRNDVRAFEYCPTISVLLPVYNVPEQFLRAVIESVQNQLYPHWELCIADDNSPHAGLRSIIEAYAAHDSRIKYVFRTSNGHIAEATNSAASLATGEFIGFLDHDDELRENALYEMVRELNSHKDADLLYSDEDKITPDGVRHYPHFKSDWNPELLLCQNYVCHFTVVRRSLFEKLGGIRKGFDGAQDWDFVLRVSEATTPDKIRHIPKILYHWRVIDGSTAKGTEQKPYVTEAQIKAVKQHLDRIGDRDAEVTSLPGIGMLRVTYRVPTPEPLVSVIIPTRNQVQLLSTCLHGLLEKTSYSNLEVIIVDNGSDDPDAQRYLEMVGKKRGVTVLHDDKPFNFARLNNEATHHARGEILAFLNNDIQIARPDWLHELVSNVTRTGVGAVGARLLYPHGTVQHAGVVLGIGGVADHMMKHQPSSALGYFCRSILPQNISAVTAACMVVKKDVFVEVGGFDEKEFSIAYNDIDLCLRIRSKGRLIVYTPYAELIHHESVSRGYEDTPEKLARFQREYAAMQSRWGALLLNDPYYNRNLSLERADFSLAWPPRHD